MLCLHPSSKSFSDHSKDGFIPWYLVLSFHHSALQWRLHWTPSIAIDRSCTRTVDKRFFPTPFLSGRMCLILSKKKEATKDLKKHCSSNFLHYLQKAFEPFLSYFRQISDKSLDTCCIRRCNQFNCSNKKFRQSQKAWQVSVKCNWIKRSKSVRQIPLLMVWICSRESF